MARARTHHGNVSVKALSGVTPREDRWDPQHIGSLPVEIRNAIAPYARVCGRPLVAEHSFVRYFQSGTARLIGRCDAFAWCEFIATGPRVLPEPKRNWKRINIKLFPPCGLIT